MPRRNEQAFVYGLTKIRECTTLRNLQLSCLVAVLSLLSGCAGYLDAYADVSLENDTEDLGYISALAAPSLAPGSIVTAEPDDKKGNLGLVCSWNQVLSEPPAIQPMAVPKSMHASLLRQFGQPPVASGPQLGFEVEDVRVASLQTLSVPLAAISAGSRDTSCESAIGQVKARGSKVLAVVGSLRAELVYTLLPRSSDDISVIVKQFGSLRNDDSLEVSVQGPRVVVTSRMQLGIKVLPY